MRRLKNIPFIIPLQKKDKRDYNVLLNLTPDTFYPRRLKNTHLKIIRHRRIRFYDRENIK